MARRAGIEDAAQSALDGIRSEIRRLGGLTSEIIDFSKPMVIVPAWHDITSILDEISAVHAPVLEGASIELDTEVQGPRAVYCDRDRTVQILVNLLTNSVEATRGPGSIRVMVDNTLADRTEIVFSDDGPGIGRHNRFRVFDLFFTTKAAGSGMGLPIVQKIVDAHGGLIGVESPASGGAVFRIRLPRNSDLA